MIDPIAVVTLSERKGREVVDSEVRVHSIRELYDACRRTASAQPTRVLLKGPHGEVRLHFGSVIHEDKR